MKVLYLGVKRMAGKSKKDASPYDFSNLLYARPIELVQRENVTITGYGHEQTEIAIDPQAMGQFSSIKSGTTVDVLIEPMPTNPQRNWAVGVAS